MPEKVKTETQIACQRDARRSKSTSVWSPPPAIGRATRRRAIWRPSPNLDRDRPQQIRRSDHHGVPIERLPFEDVAYWPELVDTSPRLAMTSMLALCWGAQALLYHLYGLPKVEYPGKLSGVYEHRWPNAIRFSDRCQLGAGVALTEVPRAAIAGEADLVILADSEIAGACLPRIGRPQHLHVQPF